MLVQEVTTRQIVLCNIALKPFRSTLKVILLLVRVRKSSVVLAWSHMSVMGRTA